MTTTLDWISSDRHLIAVVASSSHTAPAHPVSHHSVAAATAAPARHCPIVAAYRHRHQEMLRRQMVFGWPDMVLPRDAGFGSGVCKGSQKLVRYKHHAVLAPLGLSTLPNTYGIPTSSSVFWQRHATRRPTLTPLPSKCRGQIKVAEVPRTMN